MRSLEPQSGSVAASLRARNPYSVNLKNNQGRFKVDSFGLPPEEPIKHSVRGLKRLILQLELNNAEIPMLPEMMNFAKVGVVRDDNPAQFLGNCHNLLIWNGSRGNVADMDNVKAKPIPEKASGSRRQIGV